MEPPSNVRIVSVLGNSVTVVAFTPPTDSLTPTGYVLEGGATRGQVLGSLPMGASATTFTFQAPTGAFYVRMHTLVGGLRSAASNEVRLFVNVAALPAAPTNLLWNVDGNTLSLAWMNNASGGAPTRLHLVVQGSVNTFLPIPVTESMSFSNVPRQLLDLGSRGQCERRRSEFQRSDRGRAWHMHCSWRTDECHCDKNRKHDFAWVGFSRQRCRTR